MTRVMNRIRGRKLYHDEVRIHQTKCVRGNTSNWIHWLDLLFAGLVGTTRSSWCSHVSQLTSIYGVPYARLTGPSAGIGNSTFPRSCTTGRETLLIQTILDHSFPQHDLTSCPTKTLLIQTPLAH